jgi:hypothetical protein
MATLKMHDFQPVPDAIYPAEVVKITNMVSKFGESFRISFKITKAMLGISEGQVVSGLVNAVLTPKSKLNKWLMAAGVKTEVGKDVNLDDMLGKNVFIEVEQKGDFSNVVDVKSAAAFSHLMPQEESKPVVKNNLSAKVEAPVQAAEAPVQVESAVEESEEDEEILF